MTNVCPSWCIIKKLGFECMHQAHDPRCEEILDETPEKYRVEDCDIVKIEGAP
jgi:hypothetical protein